MKKLKKDFVHEINAHVFSRGMRKLNSVNFLMQTDDSTKQAIFDSVCEQRIQVDQYFPTIYEHLYEGSLSHQLKPTSLI